MSNKFCKDKRVLKRSKNKLKINRKTKIVIASLVLVLLEIFTVCKITTYLKTGFNVVVTTIFIALSALWLVMLFFIILLGVCGKKND